MRSLIAFVLDLVAVLVFVGIGRSNHDESVTPGGLLDTGWPFLAGLLLGWAALSALVRAGRVRSATALTGGLVVWACVMVAGMLLRAATDQGTDPAFIVVATGILGAALVGWRLIASLVDRAGRAGTSPPPRRRVPQSQG